jgi:hypothetical protein
VLTCESAYSARVALDSVGALIFVSIGGKVRVPPLSRRLSSFLFAGWLPHANYVSWGCLGLTQGDRRCHSQFRGRIPQPSLDLLAIASFAGQPAARAGEAKRAIAQMNPTSSRATAVITIGSFFRLASICRYLARRRACAFHAMSGFPRGALSREGTMPKARLGKWEDT